MYIVAATDIHAFELTQPEATVVTGALAATAALIALIGILLIRRQKSRHFERTNALERSRALHERYTAVAEQLGHGAVPVGLAGVYAVAALADDWCREDGQTAAYLCIDLLCAYLRIASRSGQGESDVRAAVVDGRQIREAHEMGLAAADGPGGVVATDRNRTQLMLW